MRFLRFLRRAAGLLYGLLWRLLFFLLCVAVALFSRQRTPSLSWLPWVVGAASAYALFAPRKINLFARLFFTGRVRRVLTGLALLFVFVGTLGLGLAAYRALPDAHFASLETGFSESGLLRDQYVLFLVPHQDDDVNMAASTIEAYVQAGSEVYVAFLTNGDHDGLNSLRLTEALTCMEAMGVPQENTYFLGYGDGWQGAHLYDRAPDEPAISHIGRDRTYGLFGHEDLRTQLDGTPSLYTRANCLRDVRALVDLLFPDVIYCVDYDDHADHRMTSLLLEEALGQMLNEDPAYRPRVFKALTYRTAWNGPSDYYALPFRQTVCPQSSPYPLVTPAYRWQERVRFPVLNGYAAYTKTASRVHALHEIYASQHAVVHSGNVANGDQVFFERATDSLLYRQRMTASSGDAALLTDFKLYDSSDLRAFTRFDRGVWSPTDAQRTVRVTFDAPQDVNTVTLWDNPSESDNVLHAELLFSDGSCVQVPALDPLGAKNEISFDTKRGIEWIELRLTDVEGEKAGLTEWEAALKAAQPTQFIKLMDGNGDFLYEAPSQAEMKLRLYAWPALSGNETFTLSVLREGAGQAEKQSGLSADALAFRAQGNGTYRVRVTCEQDASLFDECVLRVGDPLRWQRFLQWFEYRYDALDYWYYDKTWADRKTII